MLANAFSKNLAGGRSHSDFLKKYGKNLRVTHTTQIQLLETCAIPEGMTCQLHGWKRTEARRRVSSVQVSSFKEAGRRASRKGHQGRKEFKDPGRASDCGARAIRLYQALSGQKVLAYGHPPTLHFGAITAVVDRRASRTGGKASKSPMNRGKSK